MLHRRSERRRGDRPGEDTSSSGVEVHPSLMAAAKNRGAKEEPITPINKNIFIYTYTLRPRTLLDSYQPASGVTHRMQFENTETPS